MSLHQEIADRLWQAHLDSSPIDSIALGNPDLGLDNAYTIQGLLNAKREAAGAIISGRKLGVTAEGGMKMFGITEPVHGTLYASGMVPNGATLAVGGQVLQPKIESEVGFIMGADVSAKPASMMALMDAVEAIVPCYELPGSRIDGWPKKIEDMVSDAAGFSHYMLGEGRAAPGDLDLSKMAVTVSKNGEVISEGSGAECLGDPFNGLMWLIEKLEARGIALRKGDLVLTGALGGIIPAAAGERFETQFEGLGSVNVNFV